MSVEKRTMELDSVNALNKVLLGQQTGDDSSAVLGIIEKHAVKFTTKNIIGLTALEMLNDYFEVSAITGFIQEYKKLRELTPESNRDLMKAVDAMANKKLLEKMTVGVNVKS